MSSPKVAPIKQPDEIKDYDYDFSVEVGAGSINTAVFTTSPSGLTAVSQSITGGVVKKFWGGGTDNVDYMTKCQITTNTGKTLDLFLVIPVRDKSTPQ